MKLFYKPGACSLASHIALNEIGASFDIDKVDTAAGKTETGSDFRVISPNGYVPALEIESGEILVENPAVLQFIADRAPGTGLAPANGTIERTRVQSLLNFISSELHKAYSPFFSGEELSVPKREKLQSKVKLRLNHIETLLSDGRSYLTGDTFTVADAYAFVVSSWTPHIGMNFTGFPRVAAFIDRVEARPAVEKSMRAEGLID